MATDPLSSVPASDCNVWRGPHVFVHLAVSVADWDDAQRLAAWLSTMGTNLAIAVLIAGMIWLVGLGPFLLVHLPIVVLAASIGVWLFYVQHQFKDTSCSRDEAWSFHEAALHGSSHYQLPGVLR